MTADEEKKEEDEEEVEDIPKVPNNNFLMRRSKTPSPVRAQREKQR